MKSNTKSKQCKKAIFIAKKSWLNSEIKMHYHTRDNIGVHLKVIYSELAARLHPVEFDTVWAQCIEKANKLSSLQFERQNKKLKEWTKRTSNCAITNEGNFAFYPRMVNFTTTFFTPDEENFLNKGLGYAPDLGINNKALTNLAIHVDAALPDNNFECKVACAKIISDNSVINLTKNSKEKQLLRNIQDKISLNNLIITKADKGNSICILEKDVYIAKMNNFLSKMSLKDLPDDPTKKFNKKVITVINKSNLVFNEKEKYQLKNSNPSTPIVYGLLKIHKPDAPIRPVSSAFNAPSQKLGRKLSSMLPDLLDHKSKYSLKNTVDLVTKIKDMKLPPNAKLISFDVRNLFPSVPLVKLKNYLFEKIQNKILDIDKATQLIELVNVCISQNYFYLNDKFYIQLEGLAMGASFSPFLADFYMDIVEQKLFSLNCDLVKNILCWYRYVDDVFCVWTGSQRQINIFLNSVLNKIDESIQFTVEYGEDKLNFLDLTISIKNNIFEFDVYRKPTSTDVVIPSSSKHPLNIKKSAFHTMLDRLIKIPLNNADFKRELNTILNIAVANGYSKSFIYNLLKQKNKKNALKLVFPSDADKSKKVWRKVPYIEGISEKMQKTLIQNDIQPAYFTSNTLSNFILNNKFKPETSFLEKSGVYKVSCSDCNGIYIGKTKRSLKTRFSEHISAAKYNRNVSGLSKHLVDTGHTTSLDKLTLVHNMNGGKILDRLEILEIKKEIEKGSFLVNDQLDFAHYSPLIKTKML